MTSRYWLAASRMEAIQKYSPLDLQREVSDRTGTSRRFGRARMIETTCTARQTAMAVAFAANMSAGSSLAPTDNAPTRNATTAIRQKNSRLPSHIKMLTSERATWLPSINPAFTAVKADSERISSHHSPLASATPATMEIATSIASEDFFRLESSTPLV